jgi:hypothetical protein
VHGWSPVDLWSALLSFTSDTSDVILFGLFRISAMVALGLLAIRVGASPTAQPKDGAAVTAETVVIGKHA